MLVIYLNYYYCFQFKKQIERAPICHFITQKPTLLGLRNLVQTALVVAGSQSLEPSLLSPRTRSSGKLEASWLPNSDNPMWVTGLFSEGLIIHSRSVYV